MKKTITICLLALTITLFPIVKKASVDTISFNTTPHVLAEPLPGINTAPKSELAMKVLEVPKPAPKPPTAPIQSSGSCSDWMAQAGIEKTVATTKLILNESGCRTSAVNPKSGACGIPQAYPCSKLGCALDDSGAVCQLKWMQAYVVRTYGSWDNALAKWYSRCGSPQGCWY